MKIVTLIARILLALIFLIFGLNKFLNFIPAQMPRGVAGQFTGILFTTHYLWIIATIEVVCGLLFILNRYISLALTLIGPIIVNIFIFHSLMAPSGLSIALFAVILWFVLFYHHRTAFTGIFALNA